MQTTLRQIVDAFIATGAYAEAEDADHGRKALYARARMLKDKGLIRTSLPTGQGQTTRYTEADTLAAVCVLHASLSGWSWGLIGAINQDLRLFDSPSKTEDEFATHLSDVANGEPVIIRMEVIATPWGEVKARMGQPDTVRAADTAGEVVRSRMELPVTDLAVPILEHLARRDDA